MLNFLSLSGLSVPRYCLPSTLKVGLHPPIDLFWKYPQRYTQKCISRVVQDPVKLMIKIDHHREGLG